MLTSSAKRSKKHHRSLKNYGFTNLNYSYWSITDRGYETPCWIWRSQSKRRDGYCRIQVNGKSVYVHIAMFNIHKGEVPLGHELDHLCNQRDCINPEHLEAVTASENVTRRWQRQKANV